MPFAKSLFNWQGSSDFLNIFIRDSAKFYNFISSVLFYSPTKFYNEEISFYTKRHLEVQICTILQNLYWKCLWIMLRKYSFFFLSQFSTLLASFAHIFLCMSRIEVNELSLLKKGGVGRPPRRKNVLRKRAVMALPVGSNRHEGSWQFRPQLLSAIRHLEKEKKSAIWREILMSWWFFQLQRLALHSVQKYQKWSHISLLYFRLGVV